jgi:hypothetical protein
MEKPICIPQWTGRDHCLPKRKMVKRAGLQTQKIVLGTLGKPDRRTL